MRITFTHILRLLFLLFCLLAVSILNPLGGWRVSDMARGAPDYSNARAYGPLHRVDDMAELAARLYSPSVYSRSGEVILIDSFANGMESWVSAGYGTGASVALTTSYPRIPPFCVKLTGGSDGNHSAQIFNHVNPQTLGKLGFEASLAFPTNFNYLTFDLFRYDGTVRYKATIVLNDTEDKIKYRDEDGNLQEIADLPNLIDSYGEHHNLKLIADFENNEYVGFCLNETYHDLEGIAIGSEANTEAPKTLVRVYFYSRTGTNDWCLFDTPIVTQNEP